MRLPHALTVLLLASLPTKVLSQAGGQGTVMLYTDPDTGIPFYGYVVPGGYRFGIVMPEKPTSDFIMQLTAPLLEKGHGWVGVSMGASMKGSLLLITWPNGNDVITSARLATGYTSSSVIPYSKTSFSKHNTISLAPLPTGTYANSTHLVSTFLCTGCIHPKLSFSTDWAYDSSYSGEHYFSLAYSSMPVDEPEKEDTILSSHKGDGAKGWYAGFNLGLGNAKNRAFEKFLDLVDSQLKGERRTSVSNEGGYSKPTGTGTGPITPTATGRVVGNYTASLATFRTTPPAFTITSASTETEKVYAGIATGTEAIVTTKTADPWVHETQTPTQPSTVHAKIDPFWAWMTALAVGVYVLQAFSN